MRSLFFTWQLKILLLIGAAWQAYSAFVCKTLLSKCLPYHSNLSILWRCSYDCSIQIDSGLCYCRVHHQPSKIWVMSVVRKCGSFPLPDYARPTSMESRIRFVLLTFVMPALRLTPATEHSTQLGIAYSTCEFVFWIHLEVSKSGILLFNKFCL